MSATLGYLLCIDQLSMLHSWSLSWGNVLKPKNHEAIRCEAVCIHIALLGDVRHFVSLGSHLFELSPNAKFMMPLSHSLYSKVLLLCSILVKYILHLTGRAHFTDLQDESGREPRDGW